MNEEPAGRQHYNVTLAILAVATAAYALQQMMVVPALPVLQRDLHTTTTWATWIFTAFLLASAIATPILGKLGDQYGKQRLLAIVLVIFFVGCVGAAAAWNISAMIAFRFLQGASGALFPLAYAIIRDEFPAEKVGVALGLISAILGVGAGLGILLSGVLVDNFSWRWIFIVGAVATGVSVILVHRFVPESPIKTRTRTDWVGALVLAGGLVCLLLALTEGDSWGWLSARTLGLFAGSLAILVAWVVFERRSAEPMVDMRMMARRQVFFTNLVTLFAGFSMFSAFVLSPIFAQMPRGLPPNLARLVDYGFGASTTKAGLYLLPTTLGMLFAGPAAGILSRRLDSRTPLMIGMLLVACGSAIFAAWHDAPSQIMIALGVLGIGIGFAFAAMAKLITDAVSQRETGIATGMNTVVRFVGAVIGGQVGAAILSSHVIGRTPIPSASGFATAFWISAVVGLVGAVIATLLTGAVRERGIVATPAPEMAE